MDESGPKEIGVSDAKELEDVKRVERECSANTEQNAPDPEVPLLERKCIHLTLCRLERLRNSGQRARGYL